jgi:hypothetical protein
MEEKKKSNDSSNIHHSHLRSILVIKKTKTTLKIHFINQEKINELNQNLNPK